MGAGTWSAGKHSIRLFLAGLLDTLLAGVEGSLLALGRFDHRLLGLGIYEKSVYLEDKIE
jgi:hypothetical protein